MGVRVAELKSRLHRLGIPLCEGDVAKRRVDGKLLRALGATDRAELLTLIERALQEKAFRGKRGESHLIVPAKEGRVGGVLLQGLGPAEKVDADRFRKAAGALARKFARDGRGRVGVLLESPGVRERAADLDWETVGQSVAEGWLLGSYTYNNYKTSAAAKRKSREADLQVLSSKGSAAKARKEASSLRRGVSRGAILAEAVRFTRDLVNAPANEIYPESLASRARAMARREGLRCRIYGKADLERMKLGAILAVSQGSERPPRLIVLQHVPAKPRATVCIVGKAVTFDSGGLSLKPAKGMEEMKYDMAGGGAVLGLMQAVARAKLPIKVVGLVPAAENMVNGRAVRPGDVIRSGAGKTIEIINTDAEGRLVMADALHHAQQFRPDYVFDVATLTGAVLVALGSAVSGLVSNDDSFAERVFEAGESVSERVWQLPLYDEFLDAVKSPVADIKNSAGRYGGAITAAAFLSHFAGEAPWCHLDIAGTAWADRDSEYKPRGGTGVGVRLLFEFLRKLG